MATKLCLDDSAKKARIQGLNRAHNPSLLRTVNHSKSTTRQTMPPKWTANKKFNIVPPRKGQKNGRRTVTEAATDDADVESPKKTFRIIDSLPPSPEKATQAPSSDDQSPVKVFKMPPPNLEETLDAPPEDSDDDVPNCDDLYSTDEEEDRANIKPSLGKKAKGKDIKAATIIRTRRSPKVKETLSGVKRKSDELDVSIPNLELDKLFAKRKKQKPAYGKKVAAKDKTTKQPEPVRSPSMESDKGSFMRPSSVPPTPGSQKKKQKRVATGKPFGLPNIADSDIIKEQEGEPPATQFLPFKIFGENDGEMGFVSDAQAAILAETRRELEAKSHEHQQSSQGSHAGPHCPICKDPVDASDLEILGKTSLNGQVAFCRSHKAKSARNTWDLDGLPVINWSSLESRISAHHKLIKRLIKGHDCHYREVFENLIKAGQDKITTDSKGLTPGYYGPRGDQAITEYVMKSFSDLIKARSPVDRLLTSRMGVSGFVQQVLVLEIAALLVQEDFACGPAEARAKLEETAAVGELVNEEVADAVGMESREICLDESEEDW